LAEASVDVGAGVAVQRVPDDDKGLDQQRERGGALDGCLEAVVGLAGSGALLAVSERGLDRYVCT
jgi:hypothetical protein